MNPRFYLIVISGPTGVGKTDIAVQLANDLNNEIINADSRQVYQELSIGTAKPTEQEMQGVKHYFVGTVSLKKDFNAGIFCEKADEICRSVSRQKSSIIVSGGSGLYLKALTEGLDEFPVVDHKIREELNLEFERNGLEGLINELEVKDPIYYANVDRKNPQRIIRALEIVRSSGEPYSSFLKVKKNREPYSLIKIGLKRERKELYDRINQRVDKMMNLGLMEEVKSLTKHKHHNALQTVGYNESFQYLDGEITIDEAVDLIKRNSRRYAKRQLTWFGKDQEIRWFHPDSYKDIKAYVTSRLPDG